MAQDETKVEEVKKAEPVVIAKTFGDSGTKRYNGYFYEEPNVEWQDDKRVENVETMRRTDGTVRQLLLAIKAPICAAQPYIEAASEEPKHQEHKEFIEANFRDMNRSWNDLVREILTFQDFGFSIFEIVYKIKNGQICLKDLAPRIQSSILKWQISGVDELGRPRRGITQQLQTDEKEETQTEIPMEKLCVFTNDKEGDDLTGMPLIRAAYKHFYIKDNLYKISAISSERYGVGIPVITLPQSATEKEQLLAEDMARNLKSNEKAYIILPDGWKIEILTPKGNPQQGQINELIQHHDRMILCAGLAAFLNLGSQGGGSYALSSDQSPFFVKHVEAVARYIAEQITEQVIKRLIVLNFGEQDAYPKMTYPSLAEKDFAAFAGAISSLITAGLIKVDGRLIQFIHETYKLPTITQDMVDEMAMNELEQEMDSLDLPAEEEETEPVIPVDDFPEEEVEEEEEEEIIE
jgi:phage gp29-like protein